MSYEASFKERGHAWYTYRGLTQRYRRINDGLVPLIKISGSTVTIPEGCLVSDLERIANKAGARYLVREIVE